MQDKNDLIEVIEMIFFIIGVITTVRFLITSICG